MKIRKNRYIFSSQMSSLEKKTSVTMLLLSEVNLYASVMLHFISIRFLSNRFMSLVSFLCSLKILENFWVSNVFRGYKRDQWHEMGLHFGILCQRNVFLWPIIQMALSLKLIDTFFLWSPKHLFQIPLILFIFFFL